MTASSIGLSKAAASAILVLGRVNERIFGPASRAYEIVAIAVLLRIERLGWHGHPALPASPHSALLGDKRNHNSIMRKGKQ